MKLPSIGKISGIYLIRCETSGQEYIGSSRYIRERWHQHRQLLRRGDSPCRHLQNAWTKYGETAFTFHVLEECGHDQLEAREQNYIDTRKPVLNMVQDTTRHVTDAHIAKLVALNRARNAAITHCPRGHAYTEANTYLNAKGKRICRACNAERVAALRQKEMPEQKAACLAANMQRHWDNLEQRRTVQKRWRDVHKEEKRDYDLRRRERLRNAPA